MNQNERFQYTYSAKEQAELRQIRKKYLPDEKKSTEDKMARIRKLDASVARSGTVLSLCIGILGALILGLGMSLIMTDLKEMLGSHSDKAMLFGILIGIIGMAAILVAYPLYGRLTEKKRREVAPEILKLSEEILHEQNN